METTTETESPEQYHEPDMLLGQQAQYDLQQAGKWAKFIAITGFIGCGFLALFALFAGTIFALISRFSPNPSPLAAMGPLIGIPYMIMAVVMFFINYYLYLFGTRVSKGVAFIDNDLLNKGISKLKSYLKLKGIIVIILLCFYALMFVVLIVAGIGASAIMPR